MTTPSMPSLHLDLPGVRAIALSVEDDAHVAALQDLHLRCAEFVELVNHAPPGPDVARELLVDLPPGRTLADKLVIGFWEDDAMVAAADLIRDHPAPNAWCVGLLMIDPARRGAGLGARLFAAIEAWLRQVGATSLHLIVQVQNPGAERFWARQGFARGEQITQDLGDTHNTVLRMRKDLADA